MMAFARARLVSLSLLVVVLQVSTLGAAATAVCVRTDPHAGMSHEQECEMPPQLAATCPMHRAGNAQTPHDTPAANEKHHGPSFKCDCNSSMAIEGLIGAIAVLTPQRLLSFDRVHAGVLTLASPAPIELTPQVSTPPPRR